MGKGQQRNLKDSAPSGDRLARDQFVSVIVGVHTGTERAAESLRALAAAFERVEYEVFVLSDGVEADFSEVSVPVRAVIESPGVPSAMHWARAIQETRGDYIVLIDAGVLPSPGSGSALLKRMSREARTCAASGKLLLSSGSVSSAGVEFDEEAGFVPRLRGASPSYFMLLQDSAVVAVDAGMVIISRDSYEHVGPFRDQLPLFYACVDFCLRAERAGYTCAYVRDACGIDHRTGGLFSNPEQLAAAQVLGEVAGLERFCDAWVDEEGPWGARIRRYREVLDAATRDYLVSLRVAEADTVVAHLSTCGAGR